MMFNNMYAHPYLSGYGKLADEIVDIEKPIEPIMPTSALGQTVGEGGRLGHLIQSTTAAIRAGAGKIELATSMGGGAEAVGAGSYGREAREALREMKEAAGVEFTSVHSPVQIGNLSGFNPQHGFSDEQRKTSVEEIKKAIDFAADVAQGGAVVLHTGEFQRPISEQKWAKEPDGSYRFLGYQEEPGRAITYMVDDRTGRIISDVRKSQVIREPEYKSADHEHEGEDLRGNKVKIHKGDWIDGEGHYLDPINPNDLFKRVAIWDPKESRFKTQKLGWTEIEERTKWENEKNLNKQITAEEMAFKIQMQTQMLQYRGSSLYHGRQYEEQRRSAEALRQALKIYEKLEKEMPKEEVWKIMQQDAPRIYGSSAKFVLPTSRLPTEIIKEDLRQIEQGLQYTHEASAAADAQADTIQDTLDHVKPVSEYAKEQTFKSYAEAGIHAMQQTTTNQHVKKPLFVAPENIFPEMGYGSHPEELKELVSKAREEMIKALTQPMIDDPQRRFDKDFKLTKVSNPNYVSGMTKEQAAKEAEDHIKATLDTQHLGMWRAHFVPKPGETKQDTDKRFRDWYMEEVKELEAKKIIGHIHLVDSLSFGHDHLPAGQGDLPLKDVLTYLKKKGYAGTIVSEGWGEDRFEEGRILTEPWSLLGSPVYSTFSGRFGPRQWHGMEDRWYGVTNPPFYIFGAYSPSNEWVLWSEVPME
ncbi:MAG: TIM barrel protein [Candidatus Woesearchaeota archaeon]